MLAVSASLQQIPTIPGQIKSESTYAVLFMILIGVAVGFYLVRQLPSIISAWRGISLQSQEIESTRTDRLISAISDQIRSNSEVIVSINRLVASNETVIEESRAVRTHIHDRLGPAISGLSIAWLRLADLPDLAERIRQDNPDAVIPRIPKKRPGDTRGG